MDCSRCGRRLKSKGARKAREGGTFLCRDCLTSRDKLWFETVEKGGSFRWTTDEELAEAMKPFPDEMEEAS